MAISFKNLSSELETNRVNVAFVLFLFCATAFHESGKKAPNSLVQGLNSLVVELKLWSSKGEVRV